MSAYENLKTIHRRDGSHFPLYLDDGICERFLDTAVEILDDLMATWEDSGREVFHVTSPNSKFGAGSDGGFGGEVIIPLSYLDSTGSRTGDENVDKRIDGALNKACSEANAAWWCKHSAAAVAAGLTLADLNYSSIEDADLDYNDWDETYQEALVDEWVVLRFGLFYYGPDNTSPWRKYRDHEVYGFVVAEFDGAYLGNGMVTLWEGSEPFDRADKSLSRALDTMARRITLEEPRV